MIYLGLLFLCHFAGLGRRGEEHRNHGLLEAILHVFGIMEHLHLKVESLIIYRVLGLRMKLDAIGLELGIRPIEDLCQVRLELIGALAECDIGCFSTLPLNHGVGLIRVL